MPSDLASASARPAPLRVLLRDYMVQLAAWALAMETAIYAVPLLAPAALVFFGATRFEMPLVAVATAAAFSTLNRVGDRDERWFWQTLGAGTLLWLVILTLVTAFPGTGVDPARDAIVAAGHLCFSIPVLLAAERMPHVPRVADHGSTARVLRMLGLGLVSLFWFAYVVAVPIAIDPSLPGTLMGAMALVIVLDASVVVRFAGMAVGCRSPRWTMLYGAIATAMGAVLVTDVLDLLVVRQVVHLPRGSAADLIWSVPPLCLLVAFRLRHLEWRSARPLATPRPSARDREPTVVAFLLMALAGGFPLAHVALREMDMLSPTVEPAQHVAAIAAMTLVGGMAVVAYRILSRQHEAAARAREALDRRLREAKKMEALGRLSSVVTHEFLNLLNAIGGYIDLTLDSLGTDDAHADNLRRAHDVVRRTTIFTKRLLILSRGQPFRPTSVALNRTVQELMPEIRTLVTPPAVVDAKIGRDEGQVAISAEYLREVLVPLAINASEAMEHGGRLTIETSWIDLDRQEALSRAVRPGRYARLVVRDTGVGMPGEVMAHVFEPFFTTKPQPRARGLGLATTYVVVTQHDGSVEVTSELGVGTTVEFLLPAAPSATGTIVS